MNTTVESLKKRIFAARGEIPADLVLKGGKIVNVFSGEIQEKDVGIYDGVIVGVGVDYHGKEEVDLNEIIQHIDQSKIDLILVEGFKHTNFPKIELYRALKQTKIYLY